MKGIISLLLLAMYCAAPLSAKAIVPSLDWGAFLSRLAVVESGCNDAAHNAKEGAVGRYQIRQVYLDDANAILGTTYALDSMRDPAVAGRVVRAYLCHYAASYERRTGKVADAVVLARIHNGGPRGAERSATIGYGNFFENLP